MIAAHHVNSAARYSGSTRNFILDDISIKHADAHVKPLDLEAPIETKKVEAFRRGFLTPASRPLRTIFLETPQSMITPTLLSSPSRLLQGIWGSRIK